MKFEHKVTVAASKAKVQAFLDDFQKASACVPGLQEVHEVEPDVFEGIVRVRIGPLGLNVGGRGPRPGRARPGGRSGRGGRGRRR